MEKILNFHAISIRDMGWVLIEIAKDRPGLLNDVTHHIRLHNLNIKSIVGGQRSILIEVEGEVEEEVINEVGSVDGVGSISVISQPLELLGFIKVAFMNAILFYVMERDPGLLEALGYEYGKELMRQLTSSFRDFRDALYASLRILTALNALTFIGIKFAPNAMVITIGGAFDEDVGMPMTKGVIRGLVDSVSKVKHKVSIARRELGYDFIIT